MRYNAEQLHNIGSLKELRKERGLRLADVKRATGIASCCLSLYETGKNLPKLESYNKLAQFFGWELIPVRQAEAKLKPPPPADPRPDFIVGHVYYIKNKKSDKDSDNYVSFSFRYEGKQGIHHMFREIHGGWTRTYTDYQLIGKRVKEIKQ